MKTKYVNGKLELAKPSTSKEVLKKRREELALIPKEFDLDKQYGTLLIYTDGACWPNPGPGSCSYVIVDPIASKPLYSFSKTEEATTNNQMEMSALIYALEFLVKVKVKKIIFCSDSQYVINSINKEWAKSWIKKNDIKRPNFDLWKNFLKTESAIDCELIYKWVKGHNGNKFNEMADLIAEEALEKLTNKTNNEL